MNHNWHLESNQLGATYSQIWVGEQKQKAKTQNVPKEGKSDASLTGAPGGQKRKCRENDGLVQESPSHRTQILTKLDGVSHPGTRGGSPMAGKQFLQFI